MQGRTEKIVKSILFKLSVPRCVACRKRLDERERAICSSCLNEYREAKTRNCSHCSKPLSECSCPNYYLKTHFVSSLSKLVRYNTGGRNLVSSRIIFKMKNKRREDVIDFVSDEMIASIRNSHPDLPENTVVTNVPNRKSAIIDRGFDHAEVLAKAIAEKLGFEYMPLLVSEAKLPQKSMKQEERFKNAKFDLISEPDIKGRVVLIVDDVVTSGASMGNASAMLRALRPGKIIGACIAIAYKDDKILSK